MVTNTRAVALAILDDAEENEGEIEVAREDNDGTTLTYRHGCREAYRKVLSHFLKEELEEWHYLLDLWAIRSRIEAEVR